MAGSKTEEQQAWNDKRTVEQEFREMTEYVRKIRKNHMDDYKGIVLKRRREAALAWLPKIRERYEALYPELDLTSLWAQECSTMGMTMAGVDCFYHISLAAAIWILDVLDQRMLLRREGLRILAQVDGPEEAKDIPYIRDARFSSEVVEAMVQLIRCRNGQPDPFEGYLNHTTAKYPQDRSLSAEELQDRDPRELTNAQRFCLLLSLVPAELAQRAARHFEEKMWEFLDAAFAGASCYQKKLRRVEQQRDRLYEELENGEKPSRQTAALRIPTVTAESLQDCAAQKRRDLRELDRLNDQCEALWDQLQSAFRFAHTAYGTNARSPEDESISRLLALQVEDPYEICFGFLYLVETGSSLPWLYNAPMGVLQMAARQLPWTAFGGSSDYDEELDDEEADEETEAPETPPAEEPEPPAAAPRYMDWTEKKKDLYRLCYDDTPLYSPMESPFTQWKLNLPQLVYGMTNVLMPRNVHWFDEMKEDLADAGMEPGLAAGMELYLQLASDCKYPIDFEEAEPEEALPPEPVQAEKESAEPDRQARAKLQQAQEQLRTLQKKLTRQQDACRQLEEDKGRLRQQLEQTEAQRRNSLQRKNLEIAFLKRKISQPRDHERIADWVKTTFRDRLVLHPRAVDQLNDKSAKAVDVGLICDALDFLATDYWAQLFEGLTQTEVNRNCSEKYGRPFEIKATGEPTIAYTPSQYTLRYPDPATGKVTDRTMDFHLRVGNSPEKLLRIYFFHDKENRKIVVGSLPGHLRVIKLQ